MLAPPSFHGLLAAAAALARRAEAAARVGVEEEPVLSLARPLLPGEAKSFDPLALLPALGGEDSFRFLWDGAPGLCLAASGRCNSLQLSGPRRFELAQRFCGLSLQRLAASRPAARTVGGGLGVTACDDLGLQRAWHRRW